MRKFLSEQTGRSMIEMLGVLAIIGVLSVGGIAGYSKAMAKYKQNKLGDQISMLITNIRTLYGNNPDYTGLDTDAAINMGAVDKEMWGTSANGTDTITTIENVYGGRVFVNAVEGNKSFMMTITGLPQSACTYLASSDWGSSIGSGWDGVGVAEDASTPAAITTYTGLAAKQEANTTNENLPMTVAMAAGGCSAEKNTVVLEFE